ncbi:NAD-dependent protein deacylase [Neobacillus sp. D3-1R]|uniref:NAD-dependent protein deacylase n=1 Tax=Neobacillus sp. D3-1R TaxID=3445778 RepID=UPI003F9EC774
MDSKMIHTCSHLLKEAQNIVVLTGAGISTESGIKDFRSRTGLYQLAPEYILSLDYFYKHPRKFYEFAIENLYHPKALPNIGHEIIAKWEKEGKVKNVITQNIDGLHQKAGSQQVIEFHGTMKTLSCTNCGKQYSTDELVELMNETEEFYVCTACETKQKRTRYIKPNVVLFGDTGDWFTDEGFQTITQILHHADVVFVLGTSLQVTPFSIFPRFRREGVPLIIINKGKTPYDFQRDSYVIQESIGETLNKLDQELHKGPM